MQYKIELSNNTEYVVNDTEKESLEEALEGITKEQVKAIYEIVTTTVQCTKCKGTGKVDEYNYFHNGCCFKCDGTGKTARHLKKKIKNIDKYFNYAWMV